MSFGAFYSGLTGLKAHSLALNVIGNNLANVNTVGFKGSRVSFSELFSSGSGGIGVNGAGVPLQVGEGVELAGIQALFNQGAMQSTEIATDLAIQGDGFFTLKTGSGTPVYTRAGNFSFNGDGYLVNPSGYKVQGYTQRDAGGNINASGAVSDIQIPSGLTAPPLASSYFQADMNLNAGARLDDPLTASTNEAETFSTGVTVYDSLGGSHNLTIVLTPTDTNADGHLDQWNYEARIPKADLRTPSAGTADYEVIATGSLTFDGTGKLTTPASNVSLSIPAFSNGAAAQSVEWRLWDTSGNPVVTGYASGSAVNNLAQNGYGTGRLQALAVNDQGLISGVFTNGQTLGLAQLAVASFNAPSGLLARGNNSFMAALGSGPAALGAAGTGARGGIASRSLELSNVDITEQFTDLIITERGYQSNSRIITTSDALMQEALQLKR